MFQTVVEIETNYPIEGESIVGKFFYDEESKRLFINKTQFFSNVSKAAWNFEIGGYHVIKKWLNYRKGEQLVYSDLIHLQKMFATNGYLIKNQERIDGILSLEFQSSLKTIGQ